MGSITTSTKMNPLKKKGTLTEDVICVASLRKPYLSGETRIVNTSSEVMEAATPDSMPISEGKACEKSAYTRTKLS